MTERRAAALYALAFLPAGGLALALGGWVMDLSGHGAPRMPSGIDGWALNVAPALASGLLVYLALARFVGAGRSGTHGLVGHVRRSVALYLVAVVLGAILVHDGASQDFWSMGQIVLWLWLAAAGGIAADGMIAKRG